MIVILIEKRYVTMRITPDRFLHRSTKHSRWGSQLSRILSMSLTRYADDISQWTKKRETAFLTLKNDALCRSLSRFGGSSRVRTMASARAPGFPTGTNSPHRPPSRISSGPNEQLLLTTGQPHVIASIRIFPRPSCRDDSTKSDALARKAYGLSTNP